MPKKNYNIMKTSLWDLKRAIYKASSGAEKHHEDIPMGFETSCGL